MMGQSPYHPSTGELDTAWITLMVQYYGLFGLYDRGGIIAIRTGKAGCCVSWRLGHYTWIPAYHDSPTSADDVNKVVDPTGAGNAFLGAFAVALARYSGTDDAVKVKEAGAWGTIAASFAVEQLGMPTLGQDGNGEETWNGESVSSRMDKLSAKLEEYQQPV